MPDRITAQSSVTLRFTLSAALLLSLLLGLQGAAFAVATPAIKLPEEQHQQQPAEEEKTVPQQEMQQQEEETKPSPAPDTPTMLEQFRELPTQAPAPIQTKRIDQAGEEIGEQLGQLGRRLSPKFGTWLEGKLFWQISRLQILLSLILVLLVPLAERLVRTLLNRQLRQRRKAAEPINWLTILLSGVGRPLSLFIWVYGTYGALSPIIINLSAPGLPSLIQTLLRRATDIGGTIAALWLFYRLLHLLDFQVSRWAGGLPNTIGFIARSLSERLRNPVKMLLLLVFIRVMTPLFNLTATLHVLVGHLFGLLFITAIAWLVIQALNILELALLHRYHLEVADNLEARKMHTQVRFLKRLAISLVLILASGSMLMLFDRVRQLGTSILASAGIIGIVVGLAAQRSISNILVGLQIAITQPIRLDDVVIVENEWGRIEEITTTYVVIKLWDMRRLIVPTTYFTEKPFQNWTRVSSDLLGTVFIYVDYTVPVAAIREELARIVAASPLWNGKLAKTEVTSTTAQAMEVRLLISADDASKAWELRCHIREQMITFLQSRYPQCLPRVRAEFRQAAVATDEAGLPAVVLCESRDLVTVQGY